MVAPNPMYVKGASTGAIPIKVIKPNTTTRVQNIKPDKG